MSASGITTALTLQEPALPDVAGSRTAGSTSLACPCTSLWLAPGPPLVLLHGWPQHWFCWRRVVPLLSDRYRLILPDLRGNGWSGAPRRGYEKEQLATDLLTLLDTLELDKVGLVGHDWGGRTGFLACLRTPERFRAFLALAIVHPFQRATSAKAAQSWRGGYQLALSAPWWRRRRCKRRHGRSPRR